MLERGKLWENFILEEKGSAALLLHLPEVFAEIAVFGSAITPEPTAIPATSTPTETANPTQATTETPSQAVTQTDIAFGLSLEQIVIAVMATALLFWRWVWLC